MQAASALLAHALLLYAAFCFSVANSADAHSELVLYCNATGPCAPCKPQRRHDTSCSISDFSQPVTCVSFASIYEFNISRVLADDARQKVEAGERIGDTLSCMPKSAWSFKGFEMVMALLLGASMAVIKWRQRLNARI